MKLIVFVIMFVFVSNAFALYELPSLEDVYDFEDGMRTRGGFRSQDVVQLIQDMKADKFHVTVPSKEVTEEYNSYKFMFKLVEFITEHKVKIIYSGVIHFRYLFTKIQPELI